LLFTGLRRGVIRAKGGSYSRADQPIWFWTLSALYAALMVFYLVVMVRVGSDFLTRG
jgi:hypothetical protein